ncbi:MAG: ribonuclease HII [Deltaproteobacteria bacterium]|nr:ribonuclease HII [Deltaproteobacteria bacterium]
MSERGKRQRRKAARLGVLLRPERELWRLGYRLVAGVDEVGVGPLAGPVVAAAVVFPPEVSIPGVDDSKKLTPAARERLAEAIRAQALSIGVGVVGVADIDRLNIYHAALEAMRRAVLELTLVPAHLLVDARHVPGLDIPQLALVKGDARSFSIAAASIVAKVARDRMMVALDEQYPVYGFASHMGYGTRTHREAIVRYGPCPAHRRSFAPVSQLPLPGL